MSMQYRLRYMRVEDISQVVEIDQRSFPMPWSARSYLFEINDNNAGHMVVVEAVGEEQPSNGLKNVLRRLTKPTFTPVITGYAGFWLIEGEAHVSTIAVHPDYRGRGLGEVLLAGILSRSMALKAEYSVLEVRVSNESALTLYRKYEYEIVGQRKNYYRDNNEDAYLMQLSPLDEAYRGRFAERLGKLQTRISYGDLLTQAPAQHA